MRIIAVSGIVAASVVAPGVGVAYDQLSKKWQKYKRGDIGRIVRRLYKQELVQFREHNGVVTIVLSEQGRKKLLRCNYDDLSMQKKRDGKLRAVLFDIPDKHKNARDAFRKKLLDLGFLQLQESVFITPYPCKRELEFIVHFLQIANYVVLLQLGKIEMGPQLRFQSVYK